MISVTVVTPWLNARELIPNYVRAMELGQPEQVLVYDTGSVPLLKQGELEWVDRHGLIIQLMPHQASGYADACNAGLNLADTDAVLFLNNDVVARGPWLDQIRSALAPGRLVGAQLVSSPHGSVDGRPVAYLDGWCLAGMKEDLEALGGFDEEFEEPAYYSDNDLCLRAKAAGMKLVAVKTPLVHLGNYTSRLDVERREQASAANRERYLKKARELLGVGVGTR